PTVPRLFPYTTLFRSGFEARMQVDRGARYQARQHAHGEAIGMEKRQDPEDGFGGLGTPTPGMQLHGIGNQVAMREHHGLGRGGRSEEHTSELQSRGHL